MHIQVSLFGSFEFPRAFLAFSPLARVPGPLARPQIHLPSSVGSLAMLLAMRRASHAIEPRPVARRGSVDGAGTLDKSESGNADHASSAIALANFISFPPTRLLTAELKLPQRTTGHAWGCVSPGLGET
jgi:hypothetical protein